MQKKRFRKLLFHGMLSVFVSACLLLFGCFGKADPKEIDGLQLHVRACFVSNEAVTERFKAELGKQSLGFPNIATFAPSVFSFVNEREAFSVHLYEDMVLSNGRNGSWRRETTAEERALYGELVTIYKISNKDAYAPGNREHPARMGLELTHLTPEESAKFYAPQQDAGLDPLPACGD